MNIPSHPVTCNWRPRRVLWALMLLYLGLSTGYIFGTALWEAPDESSHFIYVNAFATYDRPQPPATDLEGGWLQNVTRGYEWHQPPLYYRLASYVVQLNRRFGFLAPFEDFPPVIAMPHRVFAPTPLRLAEPHLVRFLSVIMGAGTLLITYYLAGLVSPGRPWTPIIAVGWTALIPQYQYIHAYITNDGLAFFTGSLALWSLLACLQKPRSRFLSWFQAGLSVGLALVVKLVNLFLLPIAVISLGMAFYLQRLGPGKNIWLSPLALASGCLIPPGFALIIWPDLWFRITHSPTALAWERLNWRYYLGLIPFTHSSFWGHFGYFNLAIPWALYLVFDIILLIGLGAFIWSWQRETVWQERERRVSIVMLLLTIAFVVVQFAAFNLAVRQPQGRFLFPALPALAILVAYGWDSLAHHISRRPQWVIGLMLGTMCTISVYVLFGIVIPTYFF